MSKDQKPHEAIQAPLTDAFAVALDKKLWAEIPTLMAPAITKALQSYTNFARELEASSARDSKDAARYRFMRDHTTAGDRETWFFTHANDVQGNEAEADAAIDEAMEEDRLSEGRDQ